MARQRSFTSYVADRFYNELFAVINDYAEIKADSLNLRLYQVNKIGGIELTDITVILTPGAGAGRLLTWAVV